MTEAQRMFPVPEFIKGAKGSGWDIQDSRTHGGAKMAPGILHVPLDRACVLCGEAHSLAVRNHEVTHAEITLDKHGRMPVLPRGLKDEYFQVVEDARIWEHIHRSFYMGEGDARLLDPDGKEETYENGLTRYKQPSALCPAERPKWQAVYEGLDDKGRVLYAVAAGHSEWNALVRDIVQENTPAEATYDAETIKRIRDQARRILFKGVRSQRTPPIRNTYAAAAWLQEILEPPEDEKDEPKDEVDPDEGSDPDDEGEAEEREERGESERARERDAKEERAKPKDPDYEAPGGGRDGASGRMEIVEPPLGRHLPGRLVSRYRSGDEGVFIRTPHRLYIDQKVFGKKQRVTGGAVLVDISGSMGLNYEQVMEILEAAPGATIATYCGSGHVGWLKIVARDGKVIEDAHELNPEGYGNIIDLPALKWLAMQPHFRKVWVSDGGVTGLNDHFDDSITLGCELVVKKAGIVQVNPAVIGAEFMATAVANVLSGKQMLARKGA